MDGMAVLMNEVGDDEKVEFVVEEVEVTDSEGEEEDEEEEVEEEEEVDDLDEVLQIFIQFLSTALLIFSISRSRWTKKRARKIRKATRWRHVSINSTTD